MCLITRKRDVEKKKKISETSNSKLQVNHCQNQKKKLLSSRPAASTDKRAKRR